MTKKPYLIFDLYGVIFYLRKWVIVKKISIWKSILFFLKYRKSPVKHCFYLLDRMRLSSPEEFQDVVAYKGFYLPESLCLWQKGFLDNHAVMERVSSFIKKLPRSVSLDPALMVSIAHAAFKTQGLVEATGCNGAVYNQLIELKKEHNLYILSNIDPETWGNLKIKYPHVIELFNGIVASGDHHLIKPDKAIFNYLCDTFKLSPADCIMIDDQPENCAAAFSVGMQAILYTNKTNLVEEVRHITKSAL